jgi:hypothetical protein
VGRVGIWAAIIYPQCGSEAFIMAANPPSTEELRGLKMIQEEPIC